MARVAFPLVLQSPSSGSAIQGATATINQHVVGGSLGSGPAATIYTAETGAGVVATNQIVTDNLGRWTQGGPGYLQYWLTEGTYDISITGTGLTAYVITRELASGNDHGLVIANSSASIASGTAICGPSVTMTIPAATFNGDVTIIAGNSISSATPVTVSCAGGAQIYVPAVGLVSSFPIGVAGANVHLRSDGNAWYFESGLPDTGWLAATLTTGTQWVNSYPVSYRLIAERVWLRGGTTGGMGFTLPAGFRPTCNQVWVACGAGGSTAPNSLEITSAGAVAGNSGADAYSLDGVSFTIL